MKFNINNYVWVKLTDKGKNTLRLHAWNAAHREESKGYTKFQLWDLMHIFGQDMFNGAENSFDTVILINEDPA